MIFQGHTRESIQTPCLAVPSGKPIGLRIFKQCHQGNPSGSSRFLIPVGANTRYCQLRWQVHRHALCKQGCRCCGVCYLGLELPQGITYLRRGASFKQLARRRPEQQHVSHTCDSREQYIQMQPPVRILCASGSLRGKPTAINSRTCANRLPLRSSRSKEVCMSKCKALSFHSVRFRTPIPPPYPPKNLEPRAEGGGRRDGQAESGGRKDGRMDGRRAGGGRRAEGWAGGGRRAEGTIPLNTRG